jgi:acyl-CoA thioester hydrolase
VARGETDWVYLDRASGRPVSPSAEMMALYSDSLPEPLPRKSFPDALPAPDGVFHLQKRVEWRDIDAMQHVNNAAFLNMLEDTAIQCARHFGWPVQRLLDENIAIMLRRQQIEYKQPAYLDDELEIRSWLFDPRRIGATRHYAIRRLSDDALIAQAQGQWVMVDIETGRPMRVPAELLDDFAPNTVNAPHT